MKQEHIALINLLFCMGIFWSCVCRLNSNPSKIYKTVRARYTLLLGAASLHGLQPTFLGTWPGWADVVFSATVLAFLGLSMNKWRSNNDTRSNNQAGN